MEEGQNFAGFSSVTRTLRASSPHPRASSPINARSPVSSPFAAPPPAARRPPWYDPNHHTNARAVAGPSGIRRGSSPAPSDEEEEEQGGAQPMEEDDNDNESLEYVDIPDKEVPAASSQHRPLPSPEPTHSPPDADSSPRARPKLIISDLEADEQSQIRAEGYRKQLRREKRAPEEERQGEEPGQRNGRAARRHQSEEGEEVGMAGSIVDLELQKFMNRALITVEFRAGVNLLGGVNGCAFSSCPSVGLRANGSLCSWKECATRCYHARLGWNGSDHRTQCFSRWLHPQWLHLLVRPSLLSSSSPNPIADESASACQIKATDPTSPTASAATSP